MTIRWENKLDLAGADRAIKAAAGRGVGRAAREVLAESQRIVPLEDGELRGSGRVEGKGLSASVVYDTPYAVRQHEDLTLRHDEGRSAKYVETPLRNSGHLDQVAAEIRGATR